jgi:hypothetical protein
MEIHKQVFVDYLMRRRKKRMLKILLVEMSNDELE